MGEKLNLQLFAVDERMIKSADLAKVRDVDFTLQFTASIQTLMAMLGITRKIEKRPGETLKVYKVVGSLESGKVAEGETIPLSKYETSYEAIGEAELNKWRKQTTAEAITSKGYAQAVNDTNTKMIKDIQKLVRSQFIGFLGKGTGKASGASLQATLAQIWGQLQVLYEDTSIEPVYFINPLDVAEYLGDAQISTQTAFGMSYIENFLGIGNVILAADVPKGTIYATPAQNVVLYYVNVASSDMAQAFSLTTDQTGLIGVHNDSIYENATVQTVAFSGVGLFTERPAGVVVGTITGAEPAVEPTLETLAVTSVEGTEFGNTKLSVSPARAAANIYKYKVSDAATAVTYGQNVQAWSVWDGTSDITAEAGKTITVVECDSSYKAVGAGSATVIAKA